MNFSLASEVRASFSAICLACFSASYSRDIRSPPLRCCADAVQVKANMAVTNSIILIKFLISIWLFVYKNIVLVNFKQI